MAADPRVIKKYGNRRLYDTESSRYVNLEAVAELVRKGHDIQVVDAQTGDDLTRHVLTQIIVENARDGEGGPPLDFLRGMIKAQDQAHRDFLEWYLGTASEVYQKVQGAWQGQAGWPSLKAQREAWTKIWDPFGAVRTLLKTGIRSAPKEAPSEVAEEKDTTETTRDDIAELKRRIEELEVRLGGKM